VPGHVAEDERRPLEPRDPPERRQIGNDVEVAVALLPGSDLVAGHRVHLHLQREQIVAALDRVSGVGLLEEELRVQAFSHQATLHVGEGDDDGVDVAGVDLLPHLVEGQHAAILRGRRPAFTLTGVA
jgi:hypothetical protein